MKLHNPIVPSTILRLSLDPCSTILQQNLKSKGRNSNTGLAWGREEQPLQNKLFGGWMQAPKGIKKALYFLYKAFCAQDWIRTSTPRGAAT